MVKHTPPGGLNKTRRRAPTPGGTVAQRYSLLISKLAWSVLSPSEFAPWGEATSAKRRRRRAGIWWRFKTQRDDPVTRPALIVRLGFVFNPSEIDTLLRPSPSPSWQWAGQWDKTPWRRPSPLARVLAGVGPVLPSGDLCQRSCRDRVRGT